MNNILVFGMTENPGGVESFLMNYYRRLDKEKYHFDFLCNSYEKIAYEDELLEGGSKTIHFTSRSRNPVRYYKELNRFFAAHAKEYDAIWVNVSSLANIDYLKMAKRYGIPRRIIHSHNSQNMDSRLRGQLHKVNKRVITRYATDFWACSNRAADWFYGNGISRNLIEVIPNAIDLEKNRFSPEGRDRIREELGWKDKLIIGNVGRLHFQKNQKFIIKVFAELVKQRDDARLVLIGKGEDEEELRSLVKEQGLEQLVHFAGLQDNINEWLSAFDVFFFPSVFEGLSIAALEAQANGLPILVGEKRVDPQTRVLNTFAECDPEAGADVWAAKLLEVYESGRTTYDEIQKLFRKCNLDISQETGRLEELLTERKHISYKRLSSDAVKKIELSMLTVFDRFCKENDLAYTLCGGTLLGAIRHKGFIPWDDDIDIGMPRADYEKLLYDKNLDYSCVPEHMMFGRWTDGTNYYPFVRMMDNRTRIITPYFDPRTSVRNIWIDIFPFDGNPKNKEKLAPTVKYLKFLRRVLAIKHAKLGDGRNIFRKSTKYIIRAVLAPFTIPKLCRYIDEISKRYDFNNADTISCVNWGLYGMGECVDREAFVKTIDVDFEGKKFKAMSNYDEYLTGLYGDYMTLPPEEKRVQHGFKAYIKEKK